MYVHRPSLLALKEALVRVVAPAALAGNEGAVAET
jgi:hypothetical protein